MEHGGIRTSPQPQETEQIKVLESCKHKCKRAKMETDLAPRDLDRFVNGFRERLHGVWGYANKPLTTENRAD